MSGKLYQVQNGVKVDVTPTIAALTDVSSKADISLGNVNSTGQAAMAHAAMPSGQYILLPVPADNGTVTAPTDGWICFHGTAANNNVVCYVGLGILAKKLHSSAHVSYSGYGVDVYLPCSSGDVIRIVYGYMSDMELRFIYANGSAPQP